VFPTIALERREPHQTSEEKGYNNVRSLCLPHAQQRQGSDRARGDGLDYQLVAVDLRKGEQKTDAFKAMNPVAKVPVLVDRSVLEAPMLC
jgi:glutathione S-transferase